MLTTIILLIAGLALILVGANFLVDGSSYIARRFGISEFIVGLTIVGIGTSTPEMVVSFISAVQGNSDIAFGNIVGSNIANVFLILGLTSVISPISLTKNNLRRDIPAALATSLLLFLLTFDSMILGKESDMLSRFDGLILLACFVLFMIYSFRISSEPAEAESRTISSETQKPLEKTVGNPVYMSVMKILFGLGGLVLGGHLFVDSGSAIASQLGVSDAFIGITVMALGTSLPELAASITAAVKKKGQMALGNIIGSNVFNILLILGGSALINPLVPKGITMTDMVMVIASSLLILPCAYTFRKHKIDRWEGTIFFIIYILYIIHLASKL